MQEMSNSKEGSSRLELTLRVFLISIVLTIILAMSNAYLALKLGLLTSASIPAAIIAMGILKFFKNPSILEHNAIQTAASAGEAVAGGIVYTIPALILIHYWHGFDYWTNFFIAFAGGTLGVLFSIPLRRILVHDRELHFPEGRAVAEVLKTSSDRVGLKDIISGGLVGAILELFQVGFKLIANTFGGWFRLGHSLWGFNLGFSATMIGAGFLVGFDMALSIFIGAFIAWFIALPSLSLWMPEWMSIEPLSFAGATLWNEHLRYLGIGAMLFAGLWTFACLFRPLLRNIRNSLTAFNPDLTHKKMPVTERDLPVPYLVAGICVLGAAIFLFFQSIFPLENVGLDGEYAALITFIAVMYVLVAGFLFSVITGYFSGMVGVTASPGSSVVIAGILFAAWLLLVAMSQVLPLPLSAAQLKAAQAIVIVIGSMVTGIAAISNDNIQDLKVGQLVGATPWKQQIMLLLGVLVSALVIPPVMQLLFEVYGIGGVMPHEGMDISQSLPAPTAALLAAIANAVFQHSLPWLMMSLGALVILVIMIIKRAFKLDRFFHLSILGVAIGMYLPLSSSLPLFVGGFFSFVIQKKLNKHTLKRQDIRIHMQRGVMIACGLVAGAALMDVLLAIPFSYAHSPDALSLVSESFAPIAVALAILSTILLGIWVVRRVVND